MDAVRVISSVLDVVEAMAPDLYPEWGPELRERLERFNAMDLSRVLINDSVVNVVRELQRVSLDIAEITT